MITGIIGPAVIAAGEQHRADGGRLRAGAGAGQDGSGTGDVRRCHRSAADRTVAASLNRNCRQNTHAGGRDIHGSAPVTEIGESVVPVFPTGPSAKCARPAVEIRQRGYGNCVGRIGRGEACGIRIAVARGHHDGHIAGDGIGNGRVHGVAAATAAETHVDDLDIALGDDPVDAGDDSGE